LTVFTKSTPKNLTQNTTSYCCLRRGFKIYSNLFCFSGKLPFYLEFTDRRRGEKFYFLLNSIFLVGFGIRKLGVLLVVFVKIVYHPHFLENYLAEALYIND